MFNPGDLVVSSCLIAAAPPPRAYINKNEVCLVISVTESTSFIRVLHKSGVTLVYSNHFTLLAEFTNAQDI